MSYRSRIIFSAIAILLLPVLLGMTPLNFVHKIGAGCPFSQAKQALTCNPCPFNSIISQEDHAIADLPVAFFNETSIDLPGFEMLNPLSIISNSALSAVPLRC
jgi:hypothetical protein